MTAGREFDLEESIPVRISKVAKKLIKQRASRAGIRPSTWVRVEIYKVLGLSKDQE